jgi:hypothetical protein
MTRIADINDHLFTMVLRTSFFSQSLNRCPNPLRLARLDFFFDLILSSSIDLRRPNCRRRLPLNRRNRILTQAKLSLPIAPNLPRGANSPPSPPGDPVTGHLRGP